MSQPGQWQVVGSAPEVYERDLVPAVFGEWAPIVVELAHPRPGERVVDVACGTGIVARIAAVPTAPDSAGESFRWHDNVRASISAEILTPGPNCISPTPQLKRE